MLELNERYHAGVPVIIEGETGVGKTFLVEMMADLWNSSLLSKWNRTIARLWTKLAELCKGMYEVCLGLVDTIQRSQGLILDHMYLLMKVADSCQNV